jgi:hypothetical protein
MKVALAGAVGQFAAAQFESQAKPSRWPHFSFPAASAPYEFFSLAVLSFFTGAYNEGGVFAPRRSLLKSDSV